MDMKAHQLMYALRRERSATVQGTRFSWKEIRETFKSNVDFLVKQSVKNEVIEELEFWKRNRTKIFILGQTPRHIPDIETVKVLLANVKKNGDYYGIAQRIKELKRRKIQMLQSYKFRSFKIQVVVC